jgi:hypothetical protein
MLNLFQMDLNIQSIIIFGFLTFKSLVLNNSPCFSLFKLFNFTFVNIHHSSNYHGKVQKLPNKEKLPIILEYCRMNELFVLQCIRNFEILHD